MLLYQNFLFNSDELYKGTHLLTKVLGRLNGILRSVWGVTMPTSLNNSSTRRHEASYCTCAVCLQRRLHFTTVLYTDVRWASLRLHAALYSVRSRRTVRQGSTNSTLGQGVVGVCSGPSTSRISFRISKETSSVFCDSRISCHFGSEN